MSDPVSDANSVAFVFPGLAPLRWDVLRKGLWDESVCHSHLSRCDTMLRRLGAPWSLLDLLQAAALPSAPDHCSVAYPLSVATQLASFELLLRRGIVPSVLVGVSAGELAAACASGAVELEDALRIALVTGALVQRSSRRHRMAISDVSAAAIPTHDDIVVALELEPNVTVLCGETGALDWLLGIVRRGGGRGCLLPLPWAAHGPHLDPARGELLERLGELPSIAPRAALLSTVTGDYVGRGGLPSDHWWRHVRGPVHLAAALRRLVADGVRTFVEVGVVSTLAPLLSTALAGMFPGQRDLRVMSASAIGALNVRERR